jgi:hypothetical protein
MMTTRFFRLLAAIAIPVSTVSPTITLAQLNGQNIRGDLGIKAGSQAPVGVYFAVPMWFYDANEVKDDDGNTLLNLSLNSTIFGLAANVVTSKKLFGGNYGFLVAIAWANNRIAGANFDENPGAGFSDAFVQPINIGWHNPRYDAIVAYGLYIPTGRYEDGANDNTGLGMWAHEFLAGATVYLNSKRNLYAATTVSFDFQSAKKDSDTKVGNIMNLEGGAGMDFLGGGLSVGLAYYGVFKLTEDRFDSRLGNLLVNGKNSVWGLGPEASLALAWGGKVHGFATVRYQWEMDAKLTTEGSSWNVSLAFPLKPIPIPE